MQELHRYCKLAESSSDNCTSATQESPSAGAAPGKFVQPEGQVESSLYISTSAIQEQLALTEKSLSQFSFFSPSMSQHVDAAEHVAASPFPPTSGRYQAKHMKFMGSSVKKVEESENPPWDYFGLFHPIDDTFSSNEQRDVAYGLDNYDDVKQIREDEGIPRLENEDEKLSSNGSKVSEDFENLNRGTSHGVTSASPTMVTTGSGSEKEFFNGEKINSPKLSPLRAKTSEVVVPIDTKLTLMKEDGIEHKVAPEDVFRRMIDVENLFIKAFEAGIEVPRMLEANKLHFCPMLQRREHKPFSLLCMWVNDILPSLLKACLCCGEDPSQVQEAWAMKRMR
ncbi:hypothetical protein Ancab_008249 [Ancistrocladus abbreviatus]